MIAPLHVAVREPTGLLGVKSSGRVPEGGRDRTRFDLIVTFVVDVLPRMGYSLCTNIHPEESSFYDFQ